MSKEYQEYLKKSKGTTGSSAGDSEVDLRFVWLFILGAAAIYYLYKRRQARPAAQPTRQRSREAETAPSVERVGSIPSLEEARRRRVEELQRKLDEEREKKVQEELERKALISEETKRRNAAKAEEERQRKMAAETQERLKNEARERQQEAASVVPAPTPVAPAPVVAPAPAPAPVDPTLAAATATFLALAQAAAARLAPPTDTAAPTPTPAPSAREAALAAAQGRLNLAGGPAATPVNRATPVNTANSNPANLVNSSVPPAPTPAPAAAAETESGIIKLRILYGGSPEIFLELNLNSTVAVLKDLIHTRHEKKPLPADQRLVFRGGVLRDADRLEVILQKASVGTRHSSDETFAINLAIAHH